MVAAAQLNGTNVPSHWAFVLANQRPTENKTASDATTFTLAGGRYLVSCTATFGGGSVSLQDAAGNVFASFTSNGSATVDLRRGTYQLAIVTATGVSVNVKPQSYT